MRLIITQEKEMDINRPLQYKVEMVFDSPTFNEIHDLINLLHAQSSRGIDPVIGYLPRTIHIPCDGVTFQQEVSLDKIKFL